MSAPIVLALLLAVAVLAPLVGADTRYPGAGRRADRPARARRYRSRSRTATARGTRRRRLTGAA
ncbi:hypothetical protein GTQ99_18565 [Kineococcus sp. T13]|uniref:hypothetical protein n=1 Tax=Kineococcus vitellinus TaxID=2696565 RepID=UPI0014120E3E|nr:hypothetical protein [Kineococcus vitellinus]NAZ77410.1 hypothetical protein [Kineococcus vitellinus]